MTKIICFSIPGFTLNFLGLSGAGNQDSFIDFLKGRFEKYNSTIILKEPIC